jgi:glycosyltransferase involved in cell wall biosynthesis
LDSVLAQSFSDWEAICVDDGSTDGSGAILDEYAAKDARFRVIHQANAGVSAARNAALDVAKGEWVWFVDGDDVLKPHALGTFAAIQNKADVTFISMEWKHEDGVRTKYYFRPIAFEKINDNSSLNLYTLIDNSLDVDLFGYTWDKIIRREVIELGRIRFNEQLCYVEDEIFALGVFRFAESFSCLEKVLYMYRVLSTGLTRVGERRYYLIGQNFLAEGINSKYQGLRNIAFKRAIQFYIKAICQRGGLWVAIEMVKDETLLTLSNIILGRFSKIVKIFLYIFPSTIGGFILWCMINVMSVFRNIFVFIMKKIFR